MAFIEESSEKEATVAEEKKDGETSRSNSATSDLEDVVELKDNGIDGGPGTSDNKDNCSSRNNNNNNRSRHRRARVRAFVRDLLAVDYTQIALIPGVRTALIIIMDWLVFGIGNSNSTNFQLGALYVGLTDSNFSLGSRLHSMGLTLVSVVVMGTLIPSLVFHSIAGSILSAFGVAFITGCSPLLGDAYLVLALKLGTALFAIHSSVHRNLAASNGDTTTGRAVIWTLCGGSCSLLAALLPEVIGTRDAIRTNLFEVWHGFGKNMGQWRSQWGTLSHTGHYAVPSVTLSIYSTYAFIEHDKAEDFQAKKWLLKIMNHVDTIRTASLCLSNGYEMVRMTDVTTDSTGTEKTDNVMDNLYGALGLMLRDVGYAFHFPLVLYLPCARQKLQKRLKQFKSASEKCHAYAEDREEDVAQETALATKWLTSLVKLLQSEANSSVELVLDSKQWPCFSSPLTLPSRIRSAFPTKLPKLAKDPGWAIRGYALRFAVAFTLASLPEIFIGRGTSAHWFPMTVALIMGPSDAATYQKIAHRTLGTLCGIGLGSAISPLFQFEPALITLLALNTYAVVVFLPANYALFTFFVTSWVFCTTVGVGASMGVTIFYRCMWTLAAAALVLVVTYTYPPRTEFDLTTKLAAFARAIQKFVEAVVEEHNLLRARSNDTDTGSEQEIALALEQASQRVYQSRKEATQMRLSLFTCMHYAVLCPTQGYLIDPHTVAPLIASDLVEAVVIPAFLSLVKDDDDCDVLLTDLNDLKELKRLIQRLDAQAALPPGKPPSKQELSSCTMTADVGSRDGPFQKAILTAHQRLDKAGVP